MGGGGQYKVKVKCESEVAQSYLTICDPMDSSLPGSSFVGFSSRSQTCLHIRITWEVFRKFPSLTLHDSRSWTHILHSHDQLGRKGVVRLLYFLGGSHSTAILEHWVLSVVTPSVASASLGNALETQVLSPNQRLNDQKLLTVGPATCFNKNR